MAQWRLCHPLYARYMMKDYMKLPVLYMRGGTSKGAYLYAPDLPTDPTERDAMILSLYGSPDVRQIDGIGGADPLTSKLAIVGPASVEGCDVDYTFAYVGIDTAVVDYEGNCGNISSGVGIFAMLRGLVEPVEPITVVRIHNTNTHKIIEAHIPVQDGLPVVTGDFAIDGVPGTGAQIMLYFQSPSGSKTGKLLPTGNVRDTITLEVGNVHTAKNNHRIDVSFVDSATPSVFVKAKDLGYTGTEMPSDIEADAEGLLDILEDIRRTAAVRMGLATSKENASPAIPKICMVGTASTYTDIQGRVIEGASIDIVARTKALQVIHKAYAVTGGIATATAALIPGTIVNDVVSKAAKRTKTVTLGHPSGTFTFNIDIDTESLCVTKAGVARTARPIMDGIAYVKVGTY